MAIKTFTTGEVLTAADTNTYLANSGLVYIKSQTVGSGVGSVTVSDAFSSTYDNYLIQTTSIVGSTAANFGLKLGATATGYYFGLNYQTLGVAGGAFFQASNTSSFAYAGAITAVGSSMNIEVFNPFAAQRTGCRGVYLEFLAGGSLGGLTGFLDNTTSYTAFTLTPGSGTITGGTITVYGYRKA
jgi:hypothetical protein